MTFAHGFGRKDASRPDPVKPTTLFRIGAQMPLTFIADASGVYTYIRSRPYLAVRTNASPN